MFINHLIFFYLILGLSETYAQFNMTAYKQMPPLYQFEDYDACLTDTMDQTTSSIYCMVYAEISPNETSSLWYQISNFSVDHKRHYRHDHLFFGVCLERCHKLLSTLSYSQKNQLYGGTVEDKQLIAYYADVHKRESDERVHFDHVVNICLNYGFQQMYQLGLSTSIEYCDVKNKPLQFDVLDYMTSFIFAFLGLLNAFSSIYDYILKTRKPLSMQNNDFYKTDLRTRADKFLTTFSICRNYYRITQAPSKNSPSSDLIFLDAFRVFGIFLVIFAHVLMVYIAMQIENPEFFEKFYHRPEVSIIQNGTAIIQIFFVMSGFLLNVKFHEKKLISERTKLRQSTIVYLKLIAYRYLRLVPSLCASILFNATILARLQDGPFWRHFTEAERIFCREYWWKNIFFVNNYLMEKSCAHQTWYIAADMQLFELFAFVLILLTIYPKLKKLIYTSLSMLSILIPGLITYFFKFDAIYHLAPENYRYLYFKDTEIYYQTYPPFYTNIGGYLFGIIAADIYIKSKRNNNLNKYKGLLKYELLWWLILPAAFVLLFTGAIFTSYSFEKPSFWIALYAGLYKNCWAIICCLALLGMCFKLGWIAYEICRMSLFRVLGRITYQSFIWHVMVLRLLGGFYRQPVYVNKFSLFGVISLGFVLTSIVAFFAALLLEFPIAALIKAFAENSKGAEIHKNRMKEVIALRTF